MARGGSRRRLLNARKRLFNEQDGKCYYCGRLMRHDVVDHPLKCTLDHIIPQSKGGAFAPSSNAVAACRECNGERGDKDAREFLLEKMGLLA